ncbi:hypothetical protein HanPI659440_Chr09g0337071 [Helianthus annuus]|nr:hypothetical protein HanPI659440_Chr09g0337071 [Helianthus annuus]
MMFTRLGLSVEYRRMTLIINTGGAMTSGHNRFGRKWITESIGAFHIKN